MSSSFSTLSNSKPSRQQLMDVIVSLESSQEYILQTYRSTTLEYEGKIKDLTLEKEQAVHELNAFQTQANAETELLQFHIDELTTAKVFLEEALEHERAASETYANQLTEIQAGNLEVEQFNAKVTERVERLQREYESQLALQRSRLQDMTKECETNRTLLTQRDIDLQNSTIVHNNLATRVHELEDEVIRMQGKVMELTAVLESNSNAQNQSFSVPTPAANTSFAGENYQTIPLSSSSHRTWLGMLPAGLPYVSQVLEDLTTQPCSIGIQVDGVDIPPPPYDVVLQLRHQIGALETLLTESRYAKTSPQLAEAVQLNAVLQEEILDLKEKLSVIAQEKAQRDMECVRLPDSVLQAVEQWKSEALKAMQIAKNWQQKYNELFAKTNTRDLQHQATLKLLEKQHVEVVEQHATTLAELTQFVHKFDSLQKENIMLTSRLQSVLVLQQETNNTLETLQQHYTEAAESSDKFRALNDYQAKEIQKLMAEKEFLEEEKTKVLRWVSADKGGKKF